MARNLYAGRCYCCGAYVPVGYGHFERFHACKDSGNYPDKVELKMADGKMVWYHR